HEIYANPVVKQVAFEIRFPNLFFIETRIGEFQVEVMGDFPQSELVHRRSFMFVAGNPDNKSIDDLAKQQANDSTDKIWQFKSLTGTKLEISSRNLVLSSGEHRSYKNGEEPTFRTLIKRVVDPFLKMVQLAIVLRIGFRYTNECPIFDRSTERFNQCYNSILPMSRFRLGEVANMDCAVVASAKDCQYRHLESMRLTPQGGTLVLDIDAWSENVQVEKVMDVTDLLYETISNDFKSTIKEPIIDFMRKPKGGS
ncbi:MAG: TIGR04255 family protein, partial [Thermoplasmata archaeon]